MSSRADLYKEISIALLILTGLYFISIHNYVLFHSLAELFSIAIAASLFMIAWNLRRILENQYLLFISIAFLFVGIIDAIHTFVYPGMVIISGLDTNPPTQLWIAARFMQSISLLLAPLFLRKRFNAEWVVFSYAVITVFIFSTIFYFHIFPDCYIQGKGLTPFKIISEWVISVILLGALLFLIIRREAFDASVLKLLIMSILATIAAELSFTAYVSAYGLANLIGHYLKILAFYLIYKAIIQTGLTRPFNVLFRTLHSSEERYRSLVQLSPDAIFINRNNKIDFVNPAALQLFGASNAGQLLGKSPFDVFHSDYHSIMQDRIKKLLDGHPVELIEEKIVRVDGTVRDVEVAASPFHDQEGTAIQVILRDVTEHKQAEQAVRDSEERLRFALETIHTGAWDIDVVDHTAFRSLEHDRIFGYAELLPQWTYEMFLDHVLVEDRNKVDAKFRHATETQGDWSFECRIRRTDGEVRWILAAGRHRADSMGASRRMAGIVQDITERKQAEAALRESEKKYRDLVESANSVIIRWKPDGEISFINSYGLSFFGYREEDILGKNAMILIPGQDSMVHDLTGLANAMVRHPDQYINSESENVLSDGRCVWMQWTNRVILDEAGKIREILAIGTDITERKQAEEALRMAKDELEERIKERTYELYTQSLYARSLIEASLDPLVTISVDGKITDVNNASEEITGVSREQLIGSDFSDYFTEPGKARAGYEEVFRQGFVRDYPLELKRRDGHVTPVLYNASVYRDETGRNMGVFAAARDITERKQAEAALRKLASELVMAEERERKRIAGVLHDDIAQILAAARMRLGLLQGIPSDPKNQRTMEEIKSLLSQSIQETRALMNDLGNPLLFDMGLQAACEALANNLMERNPVRITCDIRDAFKYVNPDVKTILYQLIRELLNNVVKHSQAQNAQVMLDMENGQFRAKVTDDGVGFDPQMLGAPTIEGGFGLYSIRERLIAIDGSLRIESAPGSGTIVTAILPAALD